MLGNYANLMQLQNTSMFIILNPISDYNESEISKISQFLNQGGKVLMTFSDEFNKHINCNIYNFLKGFGIEIDTDCLIRAHYYKYYHPKQCFLNDLNIHNIIRNQIKNTSIDLTLVYPFGISFNVDKPSAVLLTSGLCTIPVNRVIAASCLDFKNDGKLLVFGSTSMFSDEYLLKENNWAIIQGFIKYLEASNNETFSSDLDIEINETKIVPDIMELSDKPKVYLGESMNFTRAIDYMKLFDDDLYSINLTSVPKVFQLYNQLDVKREDTLSLIAPKFETPLPPFQPAIFPPIFADIESPDLELYDFDNEYRSDNEKLHELAMKCRTELLNSDNDEGENLRDFILSCNQEFNIVQRSKAKSDDPKFILQTVVHKCFKSRFNSD